MSLFDIEAYLASTGEEPPAPAPAKTPNKTAGGAATPDPLKTVKPESLPLGNASQLSADWRFFDGYLLRDDRLT